MRIGDMVRLVIFTVIVLVATIILQVYIPATRGYFNLGEAAIYVIAILAPPLHAGIASGVGSALAYLITGFGYYAPGTLVIKFVEGFTVSLLSRKLGTVRNTRLVRVASIVIALGIGIALSVLGYILLSGRAEVTSIPINVFGSQITLINTTLDIPSLIWVCVGIVITAILLYTVIIKGRGNIALTTSMLIGGCFMVLGYLLYEYFIVNPIIFKAPPQQAFFEVPANFGQVLIGLSIGLSVTSFIAKAGGITSEVLRSKEPRS